LLPSEKGMSFASVQTNNITYFICNNDGKILICKMVLYKFCREKNEIRRWDNATLPGKS
jgi:hypothetical protein